LFGSFGLMGKYAFLALSAKFSYSIWYHLILVRYPNIYIHQQNQYLLCTSLFYKCMDCSVSIWNVIAEMENANDINWQTFSNTQLEVPGWESGNFSPQNWFDSFAATKLRMWESLPVCLQKVCDLFTDMVSHHPKMSGNSLLGAHVFIYSFHLLGNQFSKIMFIILLRSTHIQDFKLRYDTCRHCC
jgi:hypothetical protein